MSGRTFGRALLIVSALPGHAASEGRHHRLMDVGRSEYPFVVGTFDGQDFNSGDTRAEGLTATHRFTTAGTTTTCADSRRIDERHGDRRVATAKSRAAFADWLRGDGPRPRKEDSMMQRNDDTAELTWPERLRQLQQLRDPLFRRIGAAHEEGDYETRDRLWREAESLRRERGLR